MTLSVLPEFIGNWFKNHGCHTRTGEKNFLGGGAKSILPKNGPPVVALKMLFSAF